MNRKLICLCLVCLVLFLTPLVGCDCGDDDEDQADDDAVDDDIIDDDSVDDDTADDDMIDDDSVDDDSTDDDSVDDDSVDDDTADDDMIDDDSADDDSIDDDSVDDDSVDDDSIDDDSVDDDTIDDDTVVEPMIEMVAGGAPGHSGISLALASDGSRRLAAIKGRDLRVYFSEGESDLWGYETVDRFARAASLAVDGNDNWHVVYVDLVDHVLKYAGNSTGVWQTEVVDDFGFIYEQTAISVDQENVVHLVYSADWSPRLRHLVNIEGEWHMTGIPIGGGVYPRFLSLAVDDGGALHLLFFDYNTWTLLYATDQSGAWETTELEDTSQSGLFVEAADLYVEGDGAAHVGYGVWDMWSGFDEMYPIYATNRSGAWEQEIVDDSTFAGDFTTIVVGQDGTAHIAYENYYDAAGLIYASNQTGDWDLTSFGYAGMRNDIALDATDRVHLVSYARSHAIFYFRQTDRGWNAEKVDDGSQVVENTALAVDQFGHLHLCYFTLTNNALVYARNEGAGWQIETVEENVLYSRSLARLALAVDNDGFAHVSYYHQNQYSIRYATNRQGSWATTFLHASTHRAGNSIAVDGDGFAHVSLYDEIEKDLLYATDRGGEWVVTPVVEERQMGLDNSIAVDGAGAVHLGLREKVDFDHSDLWYAHNTGGDWELVPVEVGGNTGYGCSLVLDAGGHAHLSYVDGLHSQLMYAQNTTGEWQTGILQTGVTLLSTSLALDEAGHLHLAYVNSGIYYATNLNGDWTFALIDKAGVFPKQVSLALDPSGMAHVTYYSTYTIWHAAFPAGFSP